MTTIRVSTKQDIEQLAILFDEYRQFYAQQSNIEKAKSFLTERMDKNESVIFVAENNGKLIGFIQLYPTFSSVSMKRDIIMNDLYVYPEFRKNGFGKALLETAKEFCRENNCKGLWVETAIDNPARNLYEKLGWEKDVSFVHYYWQE
ncbi:MAG: GNAT family N-acetyltransferase [Sphingobacteriales bacterium]|jgi:GNAT superfamily N-acetyltransferase|nr:MAG: GNAT family N-acetyltransferase [Sphingobacteriales bacterium]